MTKFSLSVSIYLVFKARLHKKLESTTKNLSLLSSQIVMLFVLEDLFVIK